MQKKFYFILFAIGVIVIGVFVTLATRDIIRQRREKADDLGLTTEVRAAFQKRKEKAEKMIQNDPRLVTPYVELATVEKALGNLDAAIAALVRAGQISPKNNLVWANLAGLYSEAKRNRDADIMFQRALQYGPKETLNYLQYAEFLQYRYPERRADIIATYEKGLSELPGDNSIRRAFAVYYGDTGDDRKALDLWKEVLKSDPNNSGVKEEIKTIEGRLNEVNGRIE